METMRKLTSDAFSGSWRSAARHGVRCYSVARLHRRVHLRMAQLPTPAEGLGIDFAAVTGDLGRAVAMKQRQLAGKD